MSTMSSVLPASSPPPPSAPPVTVGIDVAKATLDIAVLPAGRTWQVARTEAAIATLATALAAQGPQVIVLEATGGLERLVVAGLQAAGLPVAVINPRRAREFARASGREAKTDRSDARMLAHFGTALAPAPTPAADPVRTQLAAVVSRRQQLVALRTMERNRRTTTPTDLLADLKEHIAWLTGQIRALERTLRQLLAGSVELQPLATRLQTVPGVGLMTAAVLIAELPELGTATRKQLAALAGVAPFARDSGASQGRRRCRGGRASVRTALYLAALTASRRDPALRARYQALRARGKPAKVALVACAHALLRRLAALARSGEGGRSAPSRLDGSAA